MNLIYNTGIFSLIIQILTGIFGAYVLSIEFIGPALFLKKLLWIELFVQIVEGIFYIWLITSSRKIADITKYRYYDWIITTPSMLFTYCMYLIYIASPGIAFYTAIQENMSAFMAIFCLNAAMLFFGFLAENGKITHKMGAALGFLPFFAMFYLIYDFYAKRSDIGKITFWIFSGIWGLYGIASILSYIYKNTMYNILDLFSKNFFGIFLAVVLLGS